jgi:hypothetical protein
MLFDLDDPTLFWHIDQMKSNIIKLCAVWRNNTAHLPMALQHCTDWGPSEDDLSNALKSMTTLDLDIHSATGGDSDSELSDEAADTLDFALDLMDMMQIGVQEEDNLDNRQGV